MTWNICFVNVVLKSRTLHLTDAFYVCLTFNRLLIYFGEIPSQAIDVIFVWHLPPSWDPSNHFTFGWCEGSTKPSRTPVSRGNNKMLTNKQINLYGVCVSYLSSVCPISSVCVLSLKCVSYLVHVCPISSVSVLDHMCVSYLSCVCHIFYVCVLYFLCVCILSRLSIFASRVIFCHCAVPFEVGMFVSLKDMIESD